MYLWEGIGDNFYAPRRRFVKILRITLLHLEKVLKITQMLLQKGLRIPGAHKKYIEDNFGIRYDCAVPRAFIEESLGAQREGFEDDSGEPRS